MVKKIVKEKKPMKKAVKKPPMKKSKEIQTGLKPLLKSKISMKKPKINNKNQTIKQSVNVKVTNITPKIVRPPRRPKSKVIRTAGLTPTQLAQATGSSQRITSFPAFDNVPSLGNSPLSASDTKKQIEDQVEEVGQRFIKNMILPNKKIPKKRITGLKSEEEIEAKRVETNRKNREKRASAKESKSQDNPLNFKTPDKGNESFGSDIIPQASLNPQMSESNQLVNNPLINRDNFNTFTPITRIKRLKKLVVRDEEEEDFL